MIDVLIAGKLLRDPQTRTGPSGKPYCTALVRVAIKGEETAVVSVIAFQGEGERLGRLKAGDAVSVTGTAKLSVWQKDGGETRPGLDVTATGILTAYDVKRRRGDTESTATDGRGATGHQDQKGGRNGRTGRRPESRRSGSWEAYGPSGDAAPYDDPLGF